MRAYFWSPYLSHMTRSTILYYNVKQRKNIYFCQPSSEGINAEFYSLKEYVFNMGPEISHKYKFVPFQTYLGSKR